MAIGRSQEDVWRLLPETEPDEHVSKTEDEREPAWLHDDA